MSNRNDNSAKLEDKQPQLSLRLRDQWVIGVSLVAAAVLLLHGLFRLPSDDSAFVDVEKVARNPAAFTLDPNSANAAEWALLPDIGPTLAERIVAWRNEHGGFYSVDQVRKVRGIGPKKFAVIRPYLLPIATPPTGQPTPLAANR